MNEPDEQLEEVIEERRRFELAGAVMVLAIVVTLGASAFVVFGRGNADPAPAAAPTTTASATTDGPLRLLQAVDLRSAPSAQVAIVARLLEHESIRVLGRSADGGWLAVGPSARPTVIGWVPVSQVAGVAVDELPVLADPRGGGAVAAPTFTPDLPDLVIQTAFARGNWLYVSVLNNGAGDAAGTFLVSVNDGAPVTLQVARPGEPLRAGDRLEGGVPGYPIQIRGALRVRVLLDPPLAEEDPDNNTWDGIVEPDVPNDLEVSSVEVDGPDGHLVVVIRNNSPIPISAAFTVSVREALPSTTLLGREIVSGTVDPQGTIRVSFPGLQGLSLAEIAVRLSTDGVDDAVIANNSYPR